MIYEDGAIKAELQEKGAVVGHLVVEPQKKAGYLSELPAEEVVQLFYGASFAATAVFESLGAQGTNILLVEGEPLKVHVIPRTMNDELNFFWEPKKADPSELDRVAEKVSDELWYVGKEDNNKKSSGGKSEKTNKQTEESYKVRHLIRYP